jgi:ABC-type bacteriocin/lantibiotic exporter with double-glycine peptidase domain
MSTNISPVARIFNLVKLERAEITAIYFFAILSGLIQLSLPLGVQAIIGFVIGGAMSASLVILISLVILGVLFTGLMQINQMKLNEKIQQKIFVRYSFTFAERLPKLDLKKADNFYLPELVNRFFEISTLQKGLSKLLLEIPTATIQVLFGLILLTLYHPAFILFGLLLIIILWLILYYTGSRGLQTSLLESRSKYSIAAWLEEMARIIKSLKFSTGAKYHLQKTDERVSSYLEFRTSHFRILLQQFYTLIGFKVIITAAMMIVGSLLLVKQQLNIGQFIAAEIVIILVISSVERLIGNLDNLYDVLTAVDKLGKFTDKPVEENGTLPFTPGNSGVSLQMENVSFGYTSSRKVLNNISFKINPGEKVAVAGVDGRGKSTMLRLLSGVYQDFEGAILLNNVPIGNYDLASLRSQTGIMLSQQDIFEGSLLDNITMGSSDVSLKRINELAGKTGLLSYISTLSRGYDTELDAAGIRLPRNVIHKILLVRALAHNPSLLLLEEPWQGLEEKNKKQVQETLLRESKNTTLLVATNDEEFLQRSDKIIYMDENGITVKENQNRPT